MHTLSLLINTIYKGAVVRVRTVTSLCLVEFRNMLAQCGTKHPNKMTVCRIQDSCHQLEGQGHSSHLKFVNLHFIR